MKGLRTVWRAREPERQTFHSFPCQQACINRCVCVLGAQYPPSKNARSSALEPCLEHRPLAKGRMGQAPGAPKGFREALKSLHP